MIGGVSLFTEKGLKMVNGWSNDFWGWGGEDDNMFHRLESKNIQIESSVKVAKSIQQAVLPYQRKLDHLLKDHFIINGSLTIFAVV